MAPSIPAKLLLLASVCCCAWAAGATAADAASSVLTNGSCMIQMSNRVRREAVEGASLLSEVQRSGATCTGGACVVPAGQTWILDRSMDVDTLTIQGTLEWDTNQDGLEIRAGYVIVEDGGHLKVGTRAAPMDKRATIYIKKGYDHYRLGTRVLGGMGYAKIDIHGRQLQRTWSLLSKTAFAGSTQLFVKDDPELMGWRAGDRIGLATTSRGHSSVYTIDSIGPPAPEPPSCPPMPDVKKTCSTTQCKVLAGGMTGQTCDQYCARSGLTCRAAFEEVSNDCNVAADIACDQTWPGTSDLLCECNPPPEAPRTDAGTSAVKVLHLREPLKDEHWGGFRVVAGKSLEMAAEVVNLERSVLITGDHDDFYTSNMGLHTIMSGTGYIDVRYARVEFCGQRDLMGRYCLHFHLMSKCPSCVFEGNAVVESAQVGITVHGTHNSLVSNNVVWDARAVGIYTEDGNEMNNVIKQNVVICSWWKTCSVNWLQNIGLHAGIFLIGMTNDLIENRVAGHENCIWTPGGSRGDGHGAARGKVCPTYTPFGAIRGNVNHDCIRFGLYLDNQFPRNIKRDENGYVTDKASCQKFTVDGEDNGLQPPNVVLDEFDWHNMFVGQYSMGDVQFVNYVGVNNFHSMYWKSSKNFADGRLWHIKDSFILNDPNDRIGQLQLLGPGGPHLFGIKDTVFAGGPTGCAALCAGQHCGLGGAGGPCNSQYLLEGVDFSGVERGEQLIDFGVNSIDAGEVLPMFLARDNSLNGFRSMVSRHLDGFSRVAGCSQTGAEWSNAFGCSAPIRRLNVWGPDSGDLSLSGPGYDVGPNWAAPVLGMNGGRMLYEPINGKGYGGPVLVGQRYALSGAWSGDMVIDFSEDLLPGYFGAADESVTIEVGGTQCQLRASDDRRFLSPHGPVPRVLETHARIEGGRLRCGASSGAPPKPPAQSQCGALRDVVDTCSADGCRVVAAGMRNKACSSYCASSGLFCTGAWEPTGDGCAAVVDVVVGCEEAWSSDTLICECGPEAAPPSTTSKPTTTTLLPIGTTSSLPPSGTKNPQTPQCAALPDVKTTCSADGCKVLAGSMNGLTCAEYCARSSMECAGAWEEEADDCRVKATLACDEVWPGTSDLICECATVAPTTTPAPGGTTLPVAQPTVQPPATMPECNLPDVKDFCSSSGCKVLAGGMSGKTCKDYCEESKLFCVGAWEEFDDTCTEEQALACDETLARGTTDLICECSTERTPALPTTAPPSSTTEVTTVAPLPPATAPSSPPPATTSRGASRCSALPDVKTTCSADGCKVLAGGMTDKTCAQYCARGGLQCTGAWEEEANDCKVKATLKCDEVWPGTSDLLCECGGAAATTTAAAPATTQAAAPSGWERREGFNCFGGRGARSIPGKSPLPGTFLLEDCQRECVADTACEGVVMVRRLMLEGTPYTCWLRTGLVLSDCVTDSAYDLWLRPPTSRADASPGAAATTTAAAPSGWVHHEGFNCFGGRGAGSIPGKSPLPGTFLLADCRRECEAEAECEGVVMVRRYMQEGTPYSCWLRKDVVLSDCVANSAYDLWLRRPASFAAAIPGAASV